jgi:hypothetical protein
MKAITSWILTAAGAKARQVSEQVVRTARKGWMLLTVLTTLANRFRWQLAVATGVGVLVGVVCYLAGREVASAVCGFAGFVGSLLSNAAAKVQRLFPFRFAS